MLHIKYQSKGLHKKILKCISKSEARIVLCKGASLDAPQQILVNLVKQFLRGRFLNLSAS